MTAINGDHPAARLSGGLYDSWGKLAANLGVPFAVLILNIMVLIPKIDEGIRIAERVDGELNILAVNCAALKAPTTTVIVPAQPQP